jgi:toxin ParE1/3/4
MHLVFSPIASADLEEIGDYIARDNPARAISFLDELETQCRKIAEMPLAFPTRDDVSPGLRMAVYDRYLIFFQVSEDTVRIERVIHGARRISDMF